MIDVKELMIDNYCTVAHESNSPIVKIKYIDVISNAVAYELSGYLAHTSTEFLLPILLNENWLLKLGFCEVSSSVFNIKADDCMNLEVIDFKHIILVQKYINNLNASEQRIGLRKTKFVHELQNLFWCLFGEELKLKENNPIKEVFKAGYKNVGSEISITKGQSPIDGS